MSDFDKEAERERLREQYEREQEKREATEQMSELLLKGATMTNAHCETCGDPIFRYDGQEFCPTCQQVVDDGQADADEGAGRTGEAAADGTDADADAAGTATPDAEAEHDTTGTADATANGDVEAADTTADGDPGASDSADHIEIKRPTAPSAPESAGSGGSVADGETGDHERQSSAPDAGSDPAPRRERSTPSGTEVGGSGDLAEARASLVRALETNARRAERCEDPRRAKEYLAAAREAAEALSALPY